MILIRATTKAECMNLCNKSNY